MAHDSRPPREDPPPAPVLALLETELARAQRRLVELGSAFTDLVDASTNANVDDEHDPEGATIAFERSQIDAHVRRTRLQVEELEAARRRVLDGTYGVCERCGRPIASARLEVRPTARTCVGCAAG